MYLVKALDEAVGRIEIDLEVQWVTDQIRLVADTEIDWYRDHPDVFTILSGPTLGLQGSDIDNSLLIGGTDGEYGVSMAGHTIGFIDFNAQGEVLATVTIGGLVYTEADTAVPATGIWTNGADAAAGATSLIAAINGDTRTAVPFTALADESGDGVIVVMDVAGATALAITTTSASAITVETPGVGGVAAADEQVYRGTHLVTTFQLLAGAITIALPFTPTAFFLQVRTATGLNKLVTDLVTIEATPDRLLVTVDGATSVADTDTIVYQIWG